MKGLRDGHIDGLVLQDPVKMGYLGVKTMVAHLSGQPIEARIDTGRARSKWTDATAADCRWLSLRCVELPAEPDPVEMAEAVSAAPRFEMRGVRKAFGPTVALDGVDFAVRCG